MSELRPYSGETKREHPLLELGPIAPWHATVKVVPLRLAREVTFEVYIEWTGPPADGFPPSDKPVLGSDAYVLGDLALAKELALRAESAFRRPAVPDLRGLGAALKRRAAGP
jgi:hypothetical protein